MNEFFGPNWQAILKHNNLDSFDSLWSLKTEWFEEPNIRRGGWSGVAKLTLTTPDNETVGVFIKRQKNHLSRTLWHPIKGISTFEKEFHTIKQLNKYQIPTLDLAYFNSQASNENIQAILITRELTGYQPLDSIKFTDGKATFSPTNSKKQLLHSVAQLANILHRYHFQHNCFYPKHIFIKPEAEGWSVKLIDLEKTKRTILKRSASIRDLSTLSRHAPDWSLRDRLYFFKAYVSEEKLSSKSKRLWRAIENKALRKAK